MLQMYGLPGTKKCQDIGKVFVNNRLISLLEDVVKDYVQMADESYMDRITSSADWEKPLEEIIDLKRLSQDRAFYSDWLDINALAPNSSSPQRAMDDFFSLYRLLKAKKEYKPDLSMEYTLYAVIHNEQDICEDEPDLHERVQRVPEPERSQMMEDLLKEAERLKSSEPEAWEETALEIADELMSYYEDLEKYIVTCFEDTDCLFLDDMDEEKMESSGIADYFGVSILGDSAKVEMEGNGQHYQYRVHAWDLEEGSPSENTL